MKTVSNCSVTGSEGSYIKANVYGDLGSYVGGIWGYRGEDPTTISNCVVENIAVSGMDRVGGISGIAHYGTTSRTAPSPTPPSPPPTTPATPASLPGRI